MHPRSIVSVVIVLTSCLTACASEEDATVDDAIKTSASSSPDAMNPDPTTAVEVNPVSSPKSLVFAFPSADDVSRWSVVNDTVMGGVSVGRLEWTDGAMVFTGELSLDNNGGFASVRSPLIDPPAATQWVGSPGLEVDVRGDGRAWTVEVRMAGEDGGWIAEITTSATEILTELLPWESFEPVTRFLDPRNPNAPLDPSRIVSVAFYLVDGVEAPFRLEVLSIS